MYLQAVWQLSHRLLQEQCHEQEVELGHVGVLGQQRLQDRQAGEVARVPVDLSHSGAPASIAAHVEACIEGNNNRKMHRFRKCLASWLYHLKRPATKAGSPTNSQRQSLQGAELP